MTKIRVYELARELNLDSKALLAKMKDLGISVPGHQSTLTAAQIDKIRNIKEEDKPQVVVRRRRKAADEGGDATEAGHSEEVQAPAEVHAKAPEVAAPKEVAPPVVAQEVKAPAPEKKETPAPEQPVAAEIVAKVAEPVKPVERIQEERAKPAQTTETQVASQEAPTKSPEAPAASETPMRSIVETNLPKGVTKNIAKTPSSFDALREASAPMSAQKPAENNKLPRGGFNRPSDNLEKKTFHGATIVRKATPEERESVRALHETRNKGPRRDEQQGGSSVRVGSFSGPGQKTGHRPPKPATPPPIGEVPADDFETPSNRWSKDKRDFKGRPVEESDRPAGKSTPAGHGKKRISTRDLINTFAAVTTDEDVPDTWNSESSRRRRTVYTPSDANRRNNKAGKKRKDLKKNQITTPRAAYRVVRIEDSTISVSDLAHQLSVKGAEVVAKLMSQGMMVTLNQDVDFDTAALIASEYGFECKNVSKTEEELLSAARGEHGISEARPPIITVMGHVDHGKTSILDAIRKSNVASGESGGITQHIGAYQVEKDGEKVTFLDTPGHEAFSAMRARGAKVTDIVVLVVAADDGVKPQTVEAISHAHAAKVPIIVAVNKIDKPGINIERIYKELSEHGVQAEEWGGDVQFVQVSALKKQGIDQLLDAIQVQSEVLELNAPSEGPAEGVIVEAHLDKGRGPVATVMVMKGTLKVGDYMAAGTVIGRIRAMTDHKGRRLEKATPSTPVEVIGLEAVPMSGEPAHVTLDERSAKELAQLRKNSQERSTKTAAAVSLEDLIGRVASAEVPEVPLIVKGDTQGSVEAIVSALAKLNSDVVRNMVIHRSVGGIKETDVNLAETSGAVLLAFNVRASSALTELAEKRGVVIKYYSIIYELLDTVKSLMAGKLPPVCTEVIQGHAEVRNAISVPKVGVIAGSAVTDGKITRSSFLRLIRDEVVVYSGKIASLRRFKDDVKEVAHGYECGISFENYADIRVGDVIEAYTIVETAAVLNI